MATPTLELGFLQYFSPIFVFVLVFVLVYAMLQFTKILGENKVLHSIIAVMIAVVFLFSTGATTVVMFIAPWFTIFFIFIMFMIMAYKLFGATDDQVRTVIAKAHSLQYFVLAIGIVIILLGLGSGFGQQLLEFGATTETATAATGTEAGTATSATASYQENLIATLFNPKILGMFLILMIAALSIRAMTPAMTPAWPDSGRHH